MEIGFDKKDIEHIKRLCRREIQKFWDDAYGKLFEKIKEDEEKQWLDK